MSSLRTVRAFSAAVLVCLPAFAFAQTQGGSSEAAPPTPGAGVPDELVERILGGDAGATTEIRNFLIGSERRPEDIARRATALISRIGGQKAGIGTETLLRVIDRIASSAINMVAGSQILKVGIDNNYVPRRAIVAWDFGPPDGNVAPGFERVQPGDGRLGGAKLDGLRRPSESDMLNDGITGVERIEADVPDGDYRIMMFTQNLGDRSLMASPFGSEVVVNGTSQSVGQPDPDQWIDTAILSNRGAQATNAQATAGDAPASTSGGFISGDLNNVDPELFTRQQGGAMIIPATARGGKLIIELRGAGNSSSYLTGLIVEPASETSDLILSREAARSMVPPELRLALEENILAAAADVLAGVDPAAGDPELVELPEPILDPEENASISS